ncbi:MAG: recombinase RarA, partial [Bacilli bacterium]
VKLAGGDLRYAYNLLEVCYYSNEKHEITIDTIKEVNSKPVFFHDHDEDGHYDVLSAFQKSIRGSDVNASLHYLARLIMAGDLDSIYRRMAVCAYEDIGLANPGMGPKVDACINICEMIGLPEARIPLATVVIELALSPKTNSASSAIDRALADIEAGNIGNVPNHLKTSSNDYKYPHNYKSGYVSQQYLPDKIKDHTYYIPKDTSKYEKALKEVYDKIKKDGV